jgi:hypothetical protein
MRRLRPIHEAPVLTSILFLAGCGGATKTVIVSSPPRVATPTNANTSPPPGAQDTGQLGSFRSPSGNIGCVLLGGTARCDIERRSWQPPPRPKSCPEGVDFGQGLQIGGSGSTRFVCAGDTARDPEETVLPYGSSTRSGGFTCQSARSGITCKRSSDGHGFFISIQSYRIF